MAGGTGPIRGACQDRFGVAEVVRRWVATGLDLLFPPRCAVCHAETDPWADGGGSESAAWATRRRGGLGAPPICPVCVATVSADTRRCLSCGAPGDPGGCPRCGGGCDDWDGIVVLGPYSDTLRDAVLRAKRPAARDLRTALADLLERRHGETLAEWGADVVVPVPMHWARRALRGTNAAEGLAARLAVLTGKPVRRWLVRQRATVMQNRLPFADRRANVGDAFRAAGSVAGKRVLLVDDVVTTGGTLAACARTLRAAGAAAVHAAVVARADHGGDDPEDGDGPAAA